MIELKGKSHVDYEKYHKVIENNCSFVLKEENFKEKFKGLSKDQVETEIYLCPCGIVKIKTGMAGTSPIKIESDVCGFKQQMR